MIIKICYFDYKSGDKHKKCMNKIKYDKMSANVKTNFEFMYIFPGISNICEFLLSFGLW